MTFYEVYGQLSVENDEQCPATVDWSLNAFTAGPTSRSVLIGQGTLSPQSPTSATDTFPTNIPAGSVLLSLNRRDSSSCDATVLWSRPRFNFSGPGVDFDWSVSEKS